MDGAGTALGARGGPSGTTPGPSRAAAAALASVPPRCLCSCTWRILSHCSREYVAERRTLPVCSSMSHPSISGSSGAYGACSSRAALAASDIAYWGTCGGSRFAAPSSSHHPPSDPAGTSEITLISSSETGVSSNWNGSRAGSGSAGYGIRDDPAIPAFPLPVRWPLVVWDHRLPFPVLLALCDPCMMLWLCFLFRVRVGRMRTP